MQSLSPKKSNRLLGVNRVKAGPRSVKVQLYSDRPCVVSTSRFHPENIHHPFQGDILPQNWKRSVAFQGFRREA